MTTIKVANTQIVVEPQIYESSQKVQIQVQGPVVVEASTVGIQGPPGTSSSAPELASQQW